LLDFEEEKFCRQPSEVSDAQGSFLEFVNEVRFRYAPIGVMELGPADSMILHQRPKFPEQIALVADDAGKFQEKDRYFIFHQW
jgi:hypothetical protein